MKTTRNYPRLLITKKGTRWTEGGHPWIYETDVLRLEDPEILKKAWEEYRVSCPDGYEAPIPKDVKPRAITKL